MRDFFFLHGKTKLTAIENREYSRQRRINIRRNMTQAPEHQVRGACGCTACTVAVKSFDRPIKIKKSLPHSDWSIERLGEFLKLSFYAQCLSRSFSPIVERFSISSNFLLEVTPLRIFLASCWQAVPGQQTRLASLA